MSKKEPRRVIELHEMPGQALLETIKNGTELACALLAGAYIENATGELLARSMVDDDLAKGENGVLNSPTGILSTASARADICFCLALIDKRTHKNAKTIAKVRNRFAHSHLPIDFTDKVVKPLCDSLQLTIVDGRIPNVKPLGEEAAKKYLSQPRIKFVFSAYATYVGIVQAIFNERIETEKGETTYRRRKSPVAAGLNVTIDARKLLTEAGIIRDE